jgi:hypothetical protein
MTLAAATAFQSLASPDQPFRFVYVSGAGATTRPGRFTSLFARVKGDTETALASLRAANPPFHASSLRAAAVDPRDHTAIHPYVPVQPLYLRALLPVLRPFILALYPSFHSPTEEMGHFLAGLAMGRYDDALRRPAKDIERIGEFPIIENSAYRRLVQPTPN